MAVPPYSAALFPTSLMILLAALALEMSKFHRFHRPSLLFFKSASLTFTFALTIAVGGTVSLNGPLGSGRSGFSLKERLFSIVEKVFTPEKCHLMLADFSSSCLLDVIIIIQAYTTVTRRKTTEPSKHYVTLYISTLHNDHLTIYSDFCMY